MKRRTHFALVLMSVILALTIFVSLAQASKLQRIVPVLPHIKWWVVDTVDQTGDIGTHASIAFASSSGTPWISYYDADNTALKVAHYTGSGGNCGQVNDWDCETVDTLPDVGTSSSIDVYRSTGFPSILNVGVAYYDATNEALMFAQYGLGSWTTATILDDIGSDPPGYGQYASMKYSDTGVPMIAYFVNGSLTDSLGYAYRVSSGGNCGIGPAAGLWECQTVDSGMSRGKYASLGYSSFAGNPYIAYYDGFNGNLKYAYYAGAGLGDCGTGNAWTCIIVDGTGGDDVGKFASIHVPANVTDKLQIAYYDATNGELKYAKAVGGGSGNCGLGGTGMQCDPIESIGTMSSSEAPISLAVDSNNYPIIAFRDASAAPTSHKLKIAQTAESLGLEHGNCGPEIINKSWQCAVIETGDISKSVAEFASVAFNPDDFAMIAYSEALLYIPGYESNLKIAYQAEALALPVVKKEE